MRSRQPLLFLLLGSLTFASTASRADPQPGATPAAPEASMKPDDTLLGHWEGRLALPNGNSLRVLLDVTRGADGALAATADSPDQGARGLHVDSIRLDKDQVDFTLAIGAAYQGTLNAAGDTLTGQWKQRGASLPLEFHRGSATTAASTAAEPRRPQLPKPPLPYRAEEVSYENPAAHVKLAGTFIVPPGDGPFPAVLLLTGSGAQDRDETIFGHKPFLVLADALARRGIAVLRVDDRGIGGSTGDFTKATTEDFAGDALAGVAWLETRKEVDARRIGLVGHSEGAAVAPMAAVRSKDVAYLVLLAGPGLPGDQILLRQITDLGHMLGKPEAELAKGLELERRLLDLVKAEKDPDKLRARARGLLEAHLKQASEAERKQVEAGGGVDAQLAQLTSPWFRFFVTYDPRPTLARVKVPVLALTGEKDVQVSAKENLPAIERALKKGGNTRGVTRELPGLNHLLQTAKTGSPAEYGQIEETMSPAALTAIADFVLSIGGK
ncbi:alpha/beta hydrolase family protein [Archangium sp.]|uniref:alpha/beta hydrolase family protein n=1 Tax=Archangium sp. TaxID=1872627 RepID=UPI00389A5D5E